MVMSKEHFDRLMSKEEQEERIQTTERFRSRSWKTTAHPGKQKGHTNRGRDAAA